MGGTASVPSHFAFLLELRMGAELFTQPAETAFVNQVVKWHFPRKQSHRLDSQVEPLDINLAFGAIASNNQRTEPIDTMLEISIRFLVGLHGPKDFKTPYSPRKVQRADGVS
jgi:hypothetical protein